MEDTLYIKGDSFFSSGRSYTIISLIKNSRYSEVYRIERQSDQKSFILKILRVSRMPEGLVMDKKPRIIRYLDTSNIAQQLSVFDWGEINTDNFYIISRYFTQGLLSDRIRQGALRLNTAVHLVLDLSKTLASLQAYDSESLQIRRILHGDICPNNIMYDFDEKGDYKTYLIDIEHISHIEYDFHDAGINSIITDLDSRYCAPEVLDNEPVYNSDVFSLGIILYECCFGEYPFKCDCFGYIRDSKPEFLSIDIQMGIAGILTGILTRMLEIDPVKRSNLESVIMELNALAKVTKTSGLELDNEECFESYHINSFEHYKKEFKLPYQLDYEARVFALYKHDPEQLDPCKNKSMHHTPDSRMSTEPETIIDKPSETKNPEFEYTSLVKRPSTNSRGFKDIAGMQELKELMRKKVLFFLQNPGLAEQYKIDYPNGMLLYGPPGCGKTFFAEKFAEESGYSYALVKASDLGSTWIHGTQGKINELFKEAKDKAPCVICFDEFDAFVPERSKITSTHASGEVNEFLSQLNNCGKHKIFIIATTNNPEGIDPAILRSGRIEHKIYIPAPDFEARKAVLKHGITCRPCTENIDYDRLAELTEGYITSDLSLIINDAAMNAAYSRTFISQRLLEDTISCFKPTVSETVLKEHEEIRRRMESSPDKNKHNKIGFK